jgi:hypothetical protein
VGYDDDATSSQGRMKIKAEEVPGDQETGADRLLLLLVYLSPACVCVLVERGVSI